MEIEISQNRQDIIDNFHILYYKSYVWVKDTRWFGIPLMKNPMDMMVFQEIIYEIKPDFIIETGTLFGGTSVYMACLLDILGHGQVITIDNDNEKKVPIHPRITYLIGDCLDERIIDKVKSLVSGKVVVNLDSIHERKHVLKEMELYSDFVSVNSYLIVDDTNIGSHPMEVPDTEGGIIEGPWYAVEDFLKTHKNFEIDKSREKYLFTFNPNGYLRRICA